MDIALIGHGAIGQYVTKVIDDDPIIDVRALIMRPERIDAVQQAVSDSCVVIGDVGDLPAEIDFVVEVAGHAGLQQHGPAVLALGIDLMVVSVGALTDADLLEVLRNAAEKGRSKLLIAPGAIGGIDAIAAARQGGIDRVQYTSRKPPGAWKGTPAEDLCDLDGLTGEKVLFEGPADEAARLYPKNANVAATIALAGAGFANTEVRVVADPDAPGNVHELDIAGAFGRMTLRMEGKPLPDNPKTSSLTAFSVLRGIRNRAEAVEI
jgi:aspartate dehydrogenase